MMRLIDADKIVTWLRDVGDYRKCLEDTKTDRKFVGKIIDHIEAMPTVEAEPVIHGKWICIFEPDENDNVLCNCSVCGAGDSHAKDAVVPYCWKCGAKMVIE